MCGIFGLIQSQPFDASELARMSQLLRHRGPDDEGFALFQGSDVHLYGGTDTPESSFDTAVDHCPRNRLPDSGTLPGGGGLALGHRRLSIIDLSARGHQPMRGGDRHWISYNGEVYNYLELRQELLDAGYRFHTDSDTEVILAAYDRWGPDCLSRFNGMWALAIYDTVNQTLFVARDRFGVKPVYLFQGRGRLAFASEIKAFGALSDWQPRAHTRRLMDFLVWNVSDHGAETMFDSVRQLLPGHFMLIDMRMARQPGSDMSQLPPMQCWYRLPEEAPQALRGAEAIDTLRSLLEDAVRLRLRADVRVGSCLSGGLDSSTIVCLMGRQLGVPQLGGGLHTFTARSHDAAFDEFHHAEAAIRAAGAVSHTVTPEPGRLFDELGQLVWHQDEPFVSTSIFAQWCVFRLARQAGVVVMLDGQGADETLGGYRGFFGAYLAGLLRAGHLAQWWSELGALRRVIGFSRLRSTGYTVAYFAPQLLSLAGRFDNRAFSDRDWLRPEYKHAFEEDPIRAAGGRPRSVREMSVAQITATNLPMLLHWEDRNSMAASIEARVPFLDYRVVEHCLRMADEEKVGGGVSKRALRASMRGVVPDTILDRRDKLGFVTAEQLWVTRDMPARFRAELQGAVEALGGVLAPSILDRFDDVVAGRRPFDHRYWRAISAGRWSRAFDVRIA